MEHTVQRHVNAIASQAQAVPEKQEVPRAFEMLGAQISYGEKLVEELAARLECLLLPSPVNVDGNSKSDSAFQTSFAQGVESHAARVERINTRMHYLLRALQLP